MALIDETPFNWQLKPAPGYPGYQPKPQAQTRPPENQDYMRQIGPVIGPDGHPVKLPPTTVDGRLLTPPDDSDSGSTEPYIPSRADRPPEQWGTPDQYLTAAMNGRGMAPGPYMPQHNDIAGLLHGIVMGIGRWGSHYSGMPAIAMGNYASAYWKAYQAGMKERAGTAWQQYQHAHQMFLDRQEEELKAEKDAYALYQDDPEKLHNALMQLASKYQDAPLQNALASGNPAAVDRLLQERDKSWNDAAKIKAQQDAQQQLKTIRDQEIEKNKLQIDKLKKGEGDQIPPEWRDTPGGAGTSSGTSTSETGDVDGGGDGGKSASTSTASTDPNASDDTSPDVSGPDLTPTRGGPETTGQATPTQPRPSTQPNPNINPLVKEAADELVRTGKMPASVPKGAQQSVGTEAERQKANLDNLMNNGTITGQDPDRDLATIRKINPSLARDVEALGQYKKLVPSGGEGLYANMENLTRAVYPHWDPSVYDWIKNFESERSPDQQLLGRGATIVGDAEGVFRALQNIDENSHPIKNWIDYETGKILTGDPKWAAVGQSFYNFIVESLAAQNGGSRPTVAAIKHEMETFPITMGAKAIRAMMAQTALANVHRMEHSKFTWEQKTNRKEDPTGYDAHAVAWMKTIADLDYTTGYPRPDSKNPVPDDMKPFLGPAGSNLHRVKETGPMGPPAPMPKVKTPEEAAKLPSGTKFIMPDGRIGTVP